MCFHRCWGRITLISTDSLPRGRLSDFPVVRQPLQDKTRSPTRSSAPETCPISSKPCCLSGFYDICLWELIRNSLESLVEENTCLSRSPHCWPLAHLYMEPGAVGLLKSVQALSVGLKILLPGDLLGPRDQSNE